MFSTSAIGRFLSILKPKPVIAVVGMSLLTMPSRLSQLRSMSEGRQKWQHLNWHSPPWMGSQGFLVCLATGDGEGLRSSLMMLAGE